MSKLARITTAVMLLVPVIAFTGCPPIQNSGSLNGTWAVDATSTSGGITSSNMIIWKIQGNTITYIDGLSLSGNGWYWEIRSWVTGTFTTSNGVMHLDFTNASCADIRSKVVKSGQLPYPYAGYEDMYIANMQVLTLALTQTLQPRPYVVQGDSLVLTGLTALYRATDDFDYSGYMDICD